MEAVLHIEPIIRQTRAPIAVGHTDYIFFGERLNEDGENVGSTTANIRLGCPLETPDLGSTRSCIPLVKTFEYSPDFSRSKGNVYSETIHYFKDRKFLIPFRSKLRSGLGQNMRITHLPGLNLVREHITGETVPVCDPRAEIISDLLLTDSRFSENKNRPLRDWLTEELTTSLARTPVNALSFDTFDMARMIHRYGDQVSRTSSDLTQQSLKDIAAIVAPETNLIPRHYFTDDPVSRHLLDFRNRLVPHDLDLRSFGRLPIDTLDNIEYNSFAFQSVCDIIDCIPLTDFNIDLVINRNSDVEFYHEHVALNRLGQFEDNDTGLYTPRTILEHYLTENILNEMLQKFVHYHSDMTPEIEEIICSNPVKIKIIKTISDEAAVLLYRYNSLPDEPPLCGVYFDIALQSLAPMTIIPEPIAN